MDSSTSKVGMAALAGYVALHAGQAFVQQLPSASPSSATHAAGAVSLRGQPASGQEARPFHSAAASASAAALCVAAAGSAIAARSSKKSKQASVIACKGGKTSPGYNTLPDWNKPKAGFEGNIGDQAPLGFWDPLGFSKDQDVEKFLRRRETEIKHGRVSMFATIGYIVPEYVRLPGELSPSQGLKFADVPNGLAALSKVPAAGWVQILAFVGFIEVKYNAKYAEPGNYGKGFLGLGSLGVNATVQDPEAREKKLGAELANGRLAMMAIIGMFFQDGLTGSAWGDWANYTASPLRAFESELGVQAPLGFWDPAGLASDGDEAGFKRRRETELKHGRVAMYATIGYIVPEYYKFPGFLAPSLNINFDDVPNGLAACGKVPMEGWLQVILFCGAYEAWHGFDAYKRGGNPGEYGDGAGSFWKYATQGDANLRKRKLNSELANGRLAMMAIMGMFYQDGLTGCAWGDWSLYTDSPLRAVDLSKEMGACPPVGFWDPLQLSEFGDPEIMSSTFRRRRTVEIQHGRVAMIACIGYIVPEFVRWPGFCSPSQKLAFADIPNGLAAWNAVPAVGWWQMIGFVGVVEVSNLSGAGGKEYPGDVDGFGAFGIPRGKGIEDKAKKEKSLLAEINNGRLAMMAIMGMLFQDGLTGQAWGDWANYTDSPLR